MRLLLIWVVPVVVVVGAGCTFDARAPAGAVITCEGDGECPTDSSCSRQGCLPAGVRLPSLQAERYPTNEDTAVELALKVDDVAAPRLRVLAGPQRGSIACADDVVLCPGCDPTSCVLEAARTTYTPAPDAVGADTMTLLVENPAFIGADGAPLRGDPTIISVDITPLNDPPRLRAALPRLAITEDLPGSLNLLAVFVDVDGDPLELEVARAPGGTRGDVTLSDASALYVPGANDDAEDAFVVTASDGQAIVEALIGVDITAQNDLPRVLEAAAIGRDSETLAVTLQGVDIDGVVTGFEISTPAQRGNARIEGQRLLYVPNANTLGPDSVAVVAVDDAGERGVPTTIGLTVGPTLQALPAEVTTPEDQAINIQLVGVGQGLLRFQIANPAQGTVTVVGEPERSGAETRLVVRYQPDADSNGDETFSFDVADADGPSLAPATVRVVRPPVNDAPVLEDTQVTIEEDGVIIVRPTGLADVDGDDALTLTVAGVPDGWAVTSFADQLRVVPLADFNGEARFTVVASDSAGATAQGGVLVVVEPVPDEPVAAQLLVASGDEDNIVLVAIAGSDVDGDALTLVLDPPPTWTQIGATAAGVYALQPPPNFNGRVTTAFRVSDGTSTDEGTVDIDIAPVNDAPVIIATPLLIPQHLSGPPLLQNVRFEAVDVDGDTDLVIEVAQQPSRLTLIPRGGGVFAPTRAGLEAFLDDSVQLIARDQSSSSAPTPVRIELVGRPSCAQIQSLGESLGDTVHVIDPGERGGDDRFLAFCDMTTAGGGWTLALRLDGRDRNAAFDDKTWTNSETENADQPGRGDVEDAKLASYLLLPADELLVGLAPFIGSPPVLGARRYVRLGGLPAGRPLHESINSGGATTVDSVPPFASVGTRPSERWLSAVPGRTLGLECQQEALSQKGGVVGVRIGIVGGTTPGACDQVDSFVGVGANSNATVGQQQQGRLGVEVFPTHGLVYVRERDFTSLPSRPSCNDHVAAGHRLPGTYLVDDAPVECELPTPICGDGFVDPGEQCDDNNTNNGDFCDALCRTPVCGNSIVEGGEDCDPQGLGCDEFCIFAPFYGG